MTWYSSSSSLPSVENVMNDLITKIESSTLETFKTTYNTYNSTVPYNLFTISINDGCSLLHVCVAANNKDVARFLLEEGFDPNIRTLNGNTPLHGTAIYNKIEMARLLLEYDADVNAVNNSGTSIMKIAMDNNNLDLVRLLLDNDVKVDYNAIVFCTRCFEINTTKRLIECCNQEDTERALYAALLFNNNSLDSKLRGTRNKIKFVDLVAECLESKFNNNVYERLLYKFAKSTGCDGNVILRHILNKLDEYRQLNQQMLNEALRISADITNHGLYYIKILIEYGADPNTLDEHIDKPLLSYVVYTTLKLSSRYQRCYGKDILKQLIENGADVSICNDINGIPLLHYVVSSAKMMHEFSCVKGILKQLIENGADVNIHDSNGHTILNRLSTYRVNEATYNVVHDCIDYLKSVGAVNE